MKNNQIIDGNIFRTILNLSWPVSVGLLMQTSFNIVDTVFIGRISPEALAAVSMTFPVIFLFVAIASGIAIGTVSLISRNIGKRETKKAGSAAEQSLLLSLIFGILFAFCGFVFSRPLFGFFGADEILMPVIISYMHPIYIGSIFMFLGFASNSILRGTGDMKTPMKMMIISIILNFFLDWILIFGAGPIPALGVGGAAIATVISRFIGFCFIFYHILFVQKTLPIKLKSLMPNRKIIKNIFSVGLPASISNIAISVSMFFMLRIISVFGPEAIAAYGLAFRFSSIAFMSAGGIASATITFVGQNTGAKKMQRAIRATWIASFMAVVLTGSVGILLFMFSKTIAGIFTDDALILKMTIEYIKITAPAYGFIGLSIVTLSGLQGMGRGIPHLLITIFRLFVLKIPLSYIFSVLMSFGTIGIWTGSAISIIIAGIGSLIWFYKTSKTPEMYQ